MTLLAKSTTGLPVSPESAVMSGWTVDGVGVVAGTVEGADEPVDGGGGGVHARYCGVVGGIAVLMGGGGSR